VQSRSGLGSLHPVAIDLGGNGRCRSLVTREPGRGVLATGEACAVTVRVVLDYVWRNHYMAQFGDELASVLPLNGTA
jgi:hypothetical protein